MTHLRPVRSDECDRLAPGHLWVRYADARAVVAQYEAEIERLQVRDRDRWLWDMDVIKRIARLEQELDVCKNYFSPRASARIMELERIIESRVPMEKYEELEKKCEELEKKNQWISVNERMPVAGVGVLVHNGVAYYSPDRGGWMSLNECYPCKKIQCEVTHWMPLSVPPTEGPA